jgi:hypothetical protein
LFHAPGSERIANPIQRGLAEKKVAVRLARVCVYFQQAQ